MKKTLAALAVLGAFAAGSAYAADVTLYGIVDLGLKYTHADSDINGDDATDTLGMESGMGSGSRFGIKGTEDLGNGYAVGFVLENGFSADSGSMSQNDRLFGRESQVHVTAPWGELAFGRMSQLVAGHGTYGLTGHMSPFGNSWTGSVEGGTFQVGYGRFDNTVLYKTPSFAGFTGYAQYSFGGTSEDDWDTNAFVKDEAEGKTTANRYAAFGVTYKNYGLDLTFVADWYNWSNNFDEIYNADSTNGRDADDGFSITLGGNYDFQVLKAYVGFQYFDNMFRNTAYGSDDVTSDWSVTLGNGIGNGQQMKGYSIMAGVDAPVFGGTAMFAVGYADTEATDSEIFSEDRSYKTESTRWGVSAGYDYAFSKRTDVYGVVTWYQDSIDDEYVAAANDNPASLRDRDPSTTQFMIGLRHRF